MCNHAGRECATYWVLQSYSSLSCTLASDMAAPTSLGPSHHHVSGYNGDGKGDSFRKHQKGKVKKTLLTCNMPIYHCYIKLCTKTVLLTAQREGSLTVSVVKRRIILVLHRTAQDMQQRRVWCLNFPDNYKITVHAHKGHFKGKLLNHHFILMRLISYNDATSKERCY